MHMYEVAIRHLEWIDVDEEVFQILPMIAIIGPRWAPAVGVFTVSLPRDTLR
jgi:hypothetical protein